MSQIANDTCLLSGFQRPELLPLKLDNIEQMKLQKDDLDSLDGVEQFADGGTWQEMTEDDKHRSKWHGLFFRKQTPGNFMLRLRMTNGQTSASQFRLIADLTDEYGQGFCDLTTRQQIQMRGFTIADVPDIWRRLAAVGLSSERIGMDKIRNVCGCPVAGLTPHEMLDASAVCREFTNLFLDNQDFTNLPRKLNVTITGCLENCCHAETQDIALVPSARDLEGQALAGFNVLVGGKQGSGGNTPARSLDVLVRPEDAARLCAQMVLIFRDHGPRESHTTAGLEFLIAERGAPWFRAELEKRWGRPLDRAGAELRMRHYVDHLGIHPQRRQVLKDGPQLYYAGLMVPVGRITTAQMRGVADLAQRYGDGQVRLSVQQNVIVPNIPEDKLGAFTDEPHLKELPFDPSPIVPGLVTCTGVDYCHLALTETKDWAIRIAKNLEERTRGQRLAPVTIQMSGCSAGCALHQTATIGLQGCRALLGGEPATLKRSDI